MVLTIQKMSINFIFKLQKLINNIEELARKVQFWQKDSKSTKIPNKQIKKYKKLLRAVQKIDKTLTSILEII